MFILPFTSPSVNLENSGGKAASLARLTQLGQPVPPGFILATDAYNRFVFENNLTGQILAAVQGLTAGDANLLEEASARIRAEFSAGSLPGEIAGELVEAYRALDPQSAGVAVRSSATAEDLPDLSFAGQQETSLNVIGEEQLFRAVVDCWSSLWTARAIGYRLRNAITQEGIALAVVVQRQVPSEVSGVLFTANPLTGLLSEAVIDATFGLGEALVSGQVEPDHYVVDAASGAIRNVTLGAKRTSTRGKSGGGVESVSEDTAARQTLTAEQVRRLNTAGQQIQQAYGSPQDIEWAFAGGELSILQARPITSLFPIPLVSLDPLITWFSFGAFQGMLGPMTPLGQEAIQRVVLGVGKKLGLNIIFEQQTLFAVAGERIWIKVSDVLRNPLGFRVMHAFLGIGEPGTRLILDQLADDPRVGARKGRLRLSTLRRIIRFILPPLLQIPLSIFQPEKARKRFDANAEAFLQTIQISPGTDRFERLANIAAFMDTQGGLAQALGVMLPLFVPIMAPSLMSLNQISRLLPTDGSMSALDVTRGMPRNVTTEMDLALWQVANVIRADPHSVDAFITGDANELSARYLAGELPPAAQTALAAFMAQYGMRGPGEIDLGQVRWREDPTQVLQTLQSYLQIAPEAAPDILFTRNVQAAEESIERMAAYVRRQHGGWLKEKQLRQAARRVRILLGARETPKFTAVRAMGIVRNALLACGAEFVAAGTLLRPDDLFFLHVAELAALSHREERDWKSLVAGRRQTFEREQRRRQVPRILVSDGRVFYEGVGAETDSADLISGSPVSPGVVEGNVRVVLNPRGTQLVPGEILVCPGTDPAWTPLFMAAGGLVMEVGGMMTHGSVVAREYGIPAVVGVHQATLRLKDGQRIRLDGSSGKIKIL